MTIELNVRESEMVVGPGTAIEEARKMIHRTFAPYTMRCDGARAYADAKGKMVYVVEVLFEGER